MTYVRESIDRNRNQLIETNAESAAKSSPFVGNVPLSEFKGELSREDFASSLGMEDRDSMVKVMLEKVVWKWIDAWMFPRPRPSLSSRV